MNTTQLIEAAVQANFGVLSRDGALMVETGASTGRSTKERFVVQHPDVASDIEWGKVNQGISPNEAEEFFAKLEKQLAGQSYYEMQEYVGCFKVRVRSTSPWHIAFARNMFRENYIESLQEQIADDITIQIYHAPELTTSQLGINMPFEKAIVLDPHSMKVGIVGTAYAGEIKKSAFTLCNYLLPKYGLFPMHASANCLGDGSNSCVLFGLSGTGKTTLSADPHRFLIGDDEIVWSKNGLSNLEGGCYAKLINLDPEKEPDIYMAANRQGSILENVRFDYESRTIDFNDGTLTENTRGSYSIEALNHVFDQGREAAPPSSIVFLTADAFGALPAVAKLDEWQAQYHFISGYTAKVAGTEMGVTEPQATFSACFGAPFMPRPASVYGNLLAQLMREYNVPVWLLNTGWTNGGYGKGGRFPIPVSRTLLSAIQSGELEKAEMVRHPVFGFSVPKAVPGVDSEWLTIPEGSQVQELAKKFMANAEAKGNSISEEVIRRGGPQPQHLN
ncbi:MAG: phosphoenolpyruvate carboxykinase (ATP) [Pseudobdellovibrionaceae bacterium]|nr:phosphoenolpyruvate carboxykinase (ATP) [Bdellovibrionales bacterium]USN46526.1 MAG: phosphoenolpyruvate carboxykinase (ATP) [Pseudobdellovibrionaceae bacterium]